MYRIVCSIRDKDEAAIFLCDNPIIDIDDTFFDVETISNKISQGEYSLDKDSKVQLCDDDAMVIQQFKDDNFSGVSKFTGSATVKRTGLGIVYNTIMEVFNN